MISERGNWNNGDILICGRCQYQFRDIKDFMVHKSTDCLFECEQNKTVQYTSKPSFHHLNNADSTAYYPSSDNVNYVCNANKSMIGSQSGYGTEYNSNWNNANIENEQFNYTNELLVTNCKDNIYNTPGLPNMDYEILSMHVPNPTYMTAFDDRLIQQQVDVKLPYRQSQKEAADYGEMGSHRAHQLPVDIDSIQGTQNRNGAYEQLTMSVRPDFVAMDTKRGASSQPFDPNYNFPLLSGTEALGEDRCGEADTKADLRRSHEAATMPSKVDRKFRCDICDKPFQRHSNLQQHRILHSGEKPFQCPICGRTFSQKSNAKKHMASHKTWTSGESPGSTEGAAVDVKVRNKRLILRPSKSLSSIVDRKKYQLLPNSGNHGSFFEGGGGDNSNFPVILVHNTFECKICHQKFSNYASLRSHSIVHKDLQKFICVFMDCKQVFSDLDEFLRHLDGHKKQDELVLSCQKCGQIQKTLYDYSCHLKTHGTSRPRSGSKRKHFGGLPKPSCEYEECPVCRITFKTQADLAHHVKLHHSNSNMFFKCKQCNKLLGSMSSLRYHRARHRIQDSREPGTGLGLRRSTNQMRQQLFEDKQASESGSGTISVEEEQSDATRQPNFEDGSKLVCFCCGKLYRRRNAFESHVLMCKQKDLERERRVSIRHQRTREGPSPIPPQSATELNTGPLERANRRAKFTKTWAVKPTRKSRRHPQHRSSPSARPVVTTAAGANPHMANSSSCCGGPVRYQTGFQPTAAAEPVVRDEPAPVKYTLPSISVLNKTYDTPLPYDPTALPYANFDRYSNDSFSFLKSLEFNS